MKYLVLFFLLNLNSLNCISQIQWSKKNSMYFLSSGPIHLTIDTSMGGRISSLKLNQQEMLNQTCISCGSLFWTSPQSSWGWWPPVKSFSSKPFNSVLNNNKTELVLTSRIDSVTGFQMIKKIHADKKNNSIELTYILINQTDSVNVVAPWELTFVPTGGFYFFPKASNFTLVQKNKGNPKELIPQIDDSIVWYAYRMDDHHKKLFRDGAEGWMAMVQKNILFIKKYPDIPISQFAPQEAEVEIYTAADHAEFEVQGAYTTLQPKQSLTWSVQWYLAEIPAYMNSTMGSPTLVNYVRSIIK